MEKKKNKKKKPRYHTPPKKRKVSIKEKPRYHKLTGDISLNNGVVRANLTCDWKKDAIDESRKNYMKNKIASNNLCN